MIHFKWLRYRNYLSSGNSPIEISFDDVPRTLIVGLNGAGKSSIRSALTYSLYGKDIDGKLKGALPNSINKKNTLVEIALENNGKEYLIKRGIKPDIFEIYENGKLVEQEAATKDYQKYLETDAFAL